MNTFEEELFDPHFLFDAVPNTVANGAILRKKSAVTGSKNTIAKMQSYKRTQNFQECDHFVETLNERNKMEVMSELLCRPVSVNVVKLSATELQRWTKSEARNSQLQNSLTRHRKNRRNGKKIHQGINKITKCKDDNKRRSKYGINVQNVQHSKTQKSVIKKVHINNLMKNIKQPFIKIRRIDEVINKIAKSFAKVTPNKECKENENAKINTTNAIPNSNVNEIPQLNESTQCTNENLVDEIVHKNEQRHRLKRRRIIYDSDNSSSDDNANKRRQSLRKRNIIYNSKNSSDDNENNNAKKVILRKHKRLKSDSPEKREESYIRNQNYSSIETKYIDRKQTRPSYPQLNVAAEISDLSHNQDLSVKKNVNVSEQSSGTLNSETLKFQHSKSNASMHVPSKLNTTEDNISRKSQDDDVAIEKRISENVELEEQMEESIYSDKYLIQKHKLSKELKVLLIKLDFVRNFVENKYSATEIEQLTKVYMDFIFNSNFSKTVQSASVTCSSSKIEESSGNHLGQVTSNNLVQTSVNSHSIIKSISQLSMQHAPSKSSKLLNTAEDTGAIEISKDIFCTSSKKMSSVDESMLKNLPSQECSVENFADTTEKTANGSSSVSDLHLLPSEQNETVLGSEGRLCRIRLHKSAQCISSPKLNIRESSTTDYSFTVASTKHKKPIHRKDNKSAVYKCIICDNCFEDYSDLQQHLVEHTQKCNSASNSQKEVITLSEDLNQVPPISSKLETFGSAHCSAQNNNNKQLIHKSGMDSNNKQKNGKDVIKALRNKDDKSKSVQYVPGPNRNKCDICSQQFPTKTDLTAHIYLHTESQLQEMFKHSNQKSKHVNKRAEEKETTEIKTTGKTVDIGYNTVGSISHPTTDETKAQKSAISNEKDSKGNESRSQTILKEKKMNKIVNSKRVLGVCSCHNQPETNENCIKIEIVYLCNTCGILFRSMECLETHYRFPDHVACSGNRLNRFPYILCSSCRVLFTAVQDIRVHLEKHACLKQNCTMDIQCNICKVIFIGIGAIFYKHWWKHKKDNLYIGSEQSFPKCNLVIQKLKKVNKHGELFTVTSNRSLEGYLKIAEYVCNNCKLPFFTNDDLIKHTVSCTHVSLDTDVTISENSYVNTHKSVSVKVICSLCKDDLSLDQTEFHKHIMNKHNFIAEHQFVCISLTDMTRSFICSICTEITKSLDDFQDHWLLHSTRDIILACDCGKKYYNSLNAFHEHLTYHKNANKEDMLIYCIVSYQDTKIRCTQCNVGFRSLTCYNEHVHNNKSNCGEKTSNKDKTPDHASSALQLVKSGTLAKLKDLTDEKQLEKSTRVNAEQESSNTESFAKYKTESDKEKLIRILEGSDDSEPELIIDLQEEYTECGESLTVKEIEQIPRTFNQVSAACTETPPRKEMFPTATDSQISQSNETLPATANAQTPLKEGTSPTIASTSSSVPTCEQNVTVTETATPSALENAEEVCILAICPAPTASIQTVSNSKTFTSNTQTPSDEKTLPTATNASITDHTICQQNIIVSETTTAIAYAATASTQTVSSGETFTTNTQIPSGEETSPTTTNTSITNYPKSQQNVTIAKTSTASPPEDEEEVCILAVCPAPTASIQTVSNSKTFTSNMQTPSKEKSLSATTNASITDHTICHQNIIVSETTTAISYGATASKQTVSSGETFTTNTQIPCGEETSPTTTNTSITDYPKSQQNVTIAETSTASPLQDGREVCIQAISSAPTASTQTVSNRETFITNTQTSFDEKTSPTTTNVPITDHPTCQQNVTVTHVSAASCAEIDNQVISEQPNMKLAENLQSNKVHDTISTTNQDKPTDVKNLVPVNVQCLPKQQVGFLRVKTMAELTGRVTDLQIPPVSQSKLLLRLPNRSTSSTASTSNKQEYIVSNNVKKLAMTGVNKEALQYLQANLIRSKLSAVGNVIPASHKNVPSCNIARTNLPHSPSSEDVTQPTKKSSEFNVQNVQKQWLKSFYLDKSKDAEYKYKCKFCNYRGKTLADSLMHELPGTQNACKSRRIHPNVRDERSVIHVNQNFPTFPTITTANEVYNDGVQNNVSGKQCQSTIPCQPSILCSYPTVISANEVPNNRSLKQCQPTTMSQPSIECTSSSVYSQYSNFAASSSNTSNQIFQQNRPIMFNQPISGSASSPLYYENSNGGMSIVINQPAPIVQTIPTIDISQPSEQQVYQTSVYRTKPMTIMKTPYVQQSQNLVDFTAPEDTTTSTCNVRLQGPSFACVYCPSIPFVSQELLETHINLYHNFVCNICNRLLYNLHDLNVHKMQHGYM